MAFKDDSTTGQQISMVFFAEFAGGDAVLSVTSPGPE